MRKKRYELYSGALYIKINNAVDLKLPSVGIKDCNVSQWVCHRQSSWEWHSCSTVWLPHHWWSIHTSWEERKEMQFTHHIVDVSCSGTTQWLPAICTCTLGITQWMCQLLMTIPVLYRLHRGLMDQRAVSVRNNSNGSWSLSGYILTTVTSPMNGGTGRRYLACEYTLSPSSSCKHTVERWGERTVSQHTSNNYLLWP